MLFVHEKHTCYDSLQSLFLCGRRGGAHLCHPGSLGVRRPRHPRQSPGKAALHRRSQITRTPPEGRREGHRSVVQNRVRAGAYAGTVKGSGPRDIGWRTSLAGRTSLLAQRLSVGWAPSPTGGASLLGRGTLFLNGEAPNRDYLCWD